MFDITNKVSHIVIDNAANIVKAFYMPGFDDVAPNVINDDSSDDDDDDHVLCSDPQGWVSCLVHYVRLQVGVGPEGLHSHMIKGDQKRN